MTEKKPPKTRPYAVIHRPTGRTYLVRNAISAEAALRAVTNPPEYDVTALSANEALDLRDDPDVVVLDASKVAQAPAPLPSTSSHSQD